jgi:hypothetical protein
MNDGVYLTEVLEQSRQSVNSFEREGRNNRKERKKEGRKKEGRKEGRMNGWMITQVVDNVIST